MHSTGGTYRGLTDHAGLTPDDYQKWILHYYLHMFTLDPTEHGAAHPPDA